MPSLFLSTVLVIAVSVCCGYLMRKQVIFRTCSFIGKWKKICGLCADIKCLAWIIELEIGTSFIPDLQPILVFLQTFFELGTCTGRSETQMHFLFGWLLWRRGGFAPLP